MIRRTSRAALPLFALVAIAFFYLFPFLRDTAHQQQPRPWSPGAEKDNNKSPPLQVITTTSTATTSPARATAAATPTSGSSSSSPASPLLSSADHQDAEIVVASTKSEDTSWVHKFLPAQWKKNVYVVDDPSSSLTVKMNKGRESMVYLSYIIDRYDSLPSNVIFVHAQRFQWHNDDPDYDNVASLRRLRLARVQEAGYVNLRCPWALGCQVEIRPFEDEHADDDRQAGHVYRKIFEQLFPGEPVPEEVGVPCCAQFAVSRAAIRARSKSDYERYRQWLFDTEYNDDPSGVVFEYIWHIMFGKSAVYCPDPKECYCKNFGLCDLTCTDSACEGRYTLPMYATMPDGWPLKGWEGEDRKFDGPL